MSTLNAQLRVWSDTAANFTAANPTLAVGQWAFETDTGKVKLGDGSTAWTSLGYYSQTYEANSWTPSITGFSATPTITASNYVRIGNVCHIHCNFTGTSNATTMTMTLPFTAKNSAVQAIAGLGTDSGTVQNTPSVFKTRANSNIADLFKTFQNGAWTNSGTKGFAVCGAIQIEV